MWVLKTVALELTFKKQRKYTQPNAYFNGEL